MRLGLACLGLAAAVFLVFGRVAWHEFVAYDTRVYITENPWVRQGLTLDGVAWAFTSVHAANWHPLTWISHMVDVDLFGPRPGLHMLENVAWHAANCCLLLMALARMTGTFWRSLLVAALFAVHPLHVESVAWVVERKDVLATFFGFLCLLAWERWTRRERRSDLVLACLFLALGLLAKPMLVTWPCVLLLFDLWPLKRTQLGARRLFLEKLPLFVLAAGSAAVTVIAQRAGGAMQSLENLALGPRIANAGLAYLGYLGKTFWPADLAFYYPSAGEHALAAFLLLAVVTGIVVAARGRMPYLLVGWLFFLGTLVPVIGLVQVGGQAMADRYTYIPLIGVFVALAWLPALRPPIAGAVVLVLGFLAWRQVGTWKDTQTLARHALAVTEGNHVAHDLLGSTFLDAGRLGEAENEFRAALAIAPGDAEAASNLAAVLDLQGRPREAEEVLRAALVLSPTRAVLHRRLGLVRLSLARLLLQEGQVGAAERELALAIEANPGDAEARRGRARALLLLGREREARDELEEVLRLAPAYAHAMGDLAFLLATTADPALRDPARSLALAEQASHATQGRAAGVQDALAAAHAAAGRFADAIAAAEGAAALARHAGEVEIAARIEKRLAAYR
ncbi:MAG: tetratricopeptide repeat protein, partial [Planctomycetota bacterium]